MKKLKVTVNGTVYDVEVEEAEVSSAPAAPASAPVPAPVPAPAPKAAAKVPAGSETIESPMPGTIVDVRVTAGQSVKKDDVLLVLEAMKMENEILAGRGGTVREIRVKDGDSVNTGDVLVVVG